MQPPPPGPPPGRPPPPPGRPPQPGYPPQQGYSPQGCPPHQPQRPGYPPHPSGFPQHPGGATLPPQATAGHASGATLPVQTPGTWGPGGPPSWGGTPPGGFPADGVTVQGPPPSETGRLAITPSGRLQPPAADDLIGPYQVERELARGGMGVVYIARNTKLGRRVALKVQLAHAADSDEADRFQIEAQAAARLRHPHIVAIHEVGEDRGRPYLAMDLVEGQSLKDKIDAEGPLDQDDAARILEEMAEAVNYAHTHAILHRDIKPHNILLDAEEKALLTDFGLAKQVDSEQEGLTQTGQIMGTPAYMPPEQADGDFERVDRRADVYALGATLYQALTGQPPFEGQTAMQVVFKVLNEEVVSPKKRRPELHVDLATICLKCLEKEPEERYGTAKELAQELARFRRGEAIEARPVGLLGRLQRRARRNQKATGALFVVGLLVLCASTGAAVVAEGLRRDAVEAERKALVETERALDAQAKEKVALDEAVEAKKVALAEATKAEHSARRARALSKVYQGIHELSLERAEVAIKSFAEARREVGDLDPGLARATEVCARQAASDTRFLGSFPLPKGRLTCASVGGDLAVVTPEAFKVWRQDAPEVVAFEEAHPAGSPKFSTYLPQERLLVYGLDDASERGYNGFVIRAREWPSRRLRWEHRCDDARTLAGPLCLSTVRGVLISTQGPKDAQAWLLDPKTGRKLHVLDSEARARSARAAVGSAALLPGNPQAILLGYDDGTIHLWDLKALAPTNQAMHLHTDQLRGAVDAMLVLPPGRFGAPEKAVTLLTGTGGGTTKRTTLAQGYEPEVMQRYTRGAVRHMAYTLTPLPRLAVSYSDGRVNLYDGDFQRLASFGALRGDVSALSFSEDGRELYVAQGGRLGRWALPAASRRLAVDYEQNLVTRTETPLLAISDQGQIAYVGKRLQGGEGVLVFDAEDQREREIPIGVPEDLSPDPGHPGGAQNPRPAVRTLAFRPGGAQLALGVRPWVSAFNGTPEPGRIEVWDLLSGRVRRLRMAHEVERDRLGRPLEQIGLLRYSLDGAQLFQGFHVRDGSQAGRALLRDAESLEEVARLTWHVSSISDVSWSAAGLMSAGLDGTIALWSEEGRGRAPRRVYYHRGRGYPLEVEGREGIAMSCVPELGEPPRISGRGFRKLIGRDVPNATNRSAWGLTAVDGTVGYWEGQERSLVLGGTGEGELYLWDRDTGETLASWEGHREGSVLACKFLPGGLVLSVAQEAKLWIPLGGTFSQIHTTALGASGATVLAVDLVDWKIAALVLEGRRRSVVVVDLEPVALPEFEQDPEGAVAPYLGW